MNIFIADANAIANNLNTYYGQFIWNMQGIELLSCNDVCGHRVYKVTVQTEGYYDISFFVLTVNECIKINTLEYLKEYL